MIVVLLLCMMLLVGTYYSKSKSSNPILSEKLSSIPDLIEYIYKRQTDKDRSGLRWPIEQTHKSLLLPSKRALVKCNVPQIEGMLADSVLVNEAMPIHNGIMEDEKITVPAYAFLPYDKRRISNTIGTNQYSSIFTQNPMSCP